MHIHKIQMITHQQCYKFYKKLFLKKFIDKVFSRMGSITVNWFQKWKH